MRRRLRVGSGNPLRQFSETRREPVTSPFEDVRHALAFCDLEPDEELAVLAICYVPAPPQEPTVNFKAPVGIGLRSCRGGQVELHASGLEMEMRFPSK